MKFPPLRRFREKHQKTYILPTLYGVALGGLCLLLLGIAFASTNNAVYFLCFLLSSLAIQSLVETNKNIELLEITHFEIKDFFADETGAILLCLKNLGSKSIYDLQIGASALLSQSVPLMPALLKKEIQIPLKIKSPGIHSVPFLQISSEFPFHFARSWKKNYIDISFYVFPPRRGLSEFSRQAFVGRDLKANELDNFKSHREYQTTDSPQRIDWKVTARTEKLMVKEFDQNSATKINIRWEDCPQTEDSEKYAQLSLWIDLAEKSNYEYSLTLPKVTIGYGHGPQHRLTCLRALL